MFEKILVGVDGSEHALKAARVAGELARCLNASVLLVACVDPVPAYVGADYMQDLYSRRMAESNIILQPALDIIGEVPGGVATEIQEGPAAEVILNLASSREIGLIIMGARGLGRMTGFLFGSQSQKVVTHAACPVMFVR